MSLDAAELRHLRAELRSPDSGRRAAVVAELMRVIGPGAATLLAEALASESPEVRAQADALLERMAASGDPALERAADAARAGRDTS
jgi:hypothetical protein